jgi:glycosyltransferase involved in cell wall biosynthesis
MKQRLVSCIMPTFNRRAFVPQAIRYFLRQDFEHKELIIVDDGDGMATRTRNIFSSIHFVF